MHAIKTQSPNVAGRVVNRTEDTRVTICSKEVDNRVIVEQVAGGFGEKLKLFMEALTCSKDFVLGAKFLKPLATPRLVGGNVVIDLYVNDNENGVQELQYSVVGKLTIQKGEIMQTILVLKKRLQDVLNILNFKVIPYGRASHARAVTQGAIQKNLV